MAKYELKTPLKDEDILKLHAGDVVLLSGIIYTARDAAHKRLVELIKKGEKLPIPLEGSVIYYVGPAPAKPGYPIGPAGPTTSYRMDPFAPILHQYGVKATIGKGDRSEELRESLKKYRAVYFAATGGAAALIAKSIKSAKIVAYEDLGAEAIRELVVENLPVIVAYDAYGGDLYKEGVKAYARV